MEFSQKFSNHKKRRKIQLHYKDQYKRRLQNYANDQCTMQNLQPFSNYYNEYDTDESKNNKLNIHQGNDNQKHEYLINDPQNDGQKIQKKVNQNSKKIIKNQQISSKYSQINFGPWDIVNSLNGISNDNEQLIKQVQRYKCTEEEVILNGEKGSCKCPDGSICEFNINKQKGENCPCKVEKGNRQRYDCLRQARRIGCDLTLFQCLGSKGECTCFEDPTKTGIWDGSGVQQSCKTDNKKTRTKRVGRSKSDL